MAARPSKFTTPKAKAAYPYWRNGATLQSINKGAQIMPFKLRKHKSKS